MMRYPAERGGQALAAARPDIPALFAERQRTGHSPAETVTALWRGLTTGGQQPRTRLLLEVLGFAVTGPGFTHCSQAEDELLPRLLEAVNTREISGLSPYIRTASTKEFPRTELAHRIDCLRSGDTAAQRASPSTGG
ncbi:hypothetical protein AB0L65_08790 [Nonomuraea sp. NPDC052116]|uniref:hypothetical protein n=1 Tax=Nonomuraea sp. NPDC052116 TaxID=3155665 RepID=UPI003444296F